MTKREDVEVPVDLMESTLRIQPLYIIPDLYQFRVDGFMPVSIERCLNVFGV